RFSRNSRCRSALQPAQRLRLSSSSTPSKGIGPTGGAVGSGSAGGSRSVGQTSSRSGLGTSDRLGPPSSSAASATAWNVFVAASQLSYSSSVKSRFARRAMILAPLRVDKGEQTKSYIGSSFFVPRDLSV